MGFLDVGNLIGIHVDFYNVRAMIVGVKGYGISNIFSLLDHHLRNTFVLVIILRFSCSFLTFSHHYIHTSLILIVDVDEDGTIFLSILKLIKCYRFLIQVWSYRFIFLQDSILLSALNSKFTISLNLIISN